MTPFHKIYVAGHRGLVGSALLRKLGDIKPGPEIVTRGHAELDLRFQPAVDDFFRAEKPDGVFLAAATVGGIAANQARPADFIRDNLQIQTNVIEAARRHGTAKLMFFGSSCMYPLSAPQPLAVESLLTGPMEPTSEPYALAKIAGLILGRSCRRQYGFDFIAVIPGNTYGPGDNFHPMDGHVIPALLHRFHQARKAGAPEVSLWGSGRALREFIYVDDLAKACLFLMENYSCEPPVNIGGGMEISMLKLAEAVAATVGYQGEIKPDPSRPDGAPRKCLDSSPLAAMGWRPAVDLKRGLAETYNWYLKQESLGRFGPDPGDK